MVTPGRNLSAPWLARTFRHACISNHFGMSNDFPCEVNALTPFLPPQHTHGG